MFYEISDIKRWDKFELGIIRRGDIFREREVLSEGENRRKTAYMMNYIGRFGVVLRYLFRLIGGGEER